MSTVRLGLCFSHVGGLRQESARDSLRNALRFFRISRRDGPLEEGRLSLAPLDAGAADLDRSLEESLAEDVTHVLFLSPGVLLPFYAIQSLLELRLGAVSGISWSWRPGPVPDIFPRIGYFDPEGRPYPWFSWSAPDLFEVGWCGLDCLLLERRVLKEIADPLRRLDHLAPSLRISLALRARRIPILVDSFIQCPILVSAGALERRIMPSPQAWLEFSRDFADRKIPRERNFDPAYRGRSWYRDWVKRCFSASDLEFAAGAEPAGN